MVEKIIVLLQGFMSIFLKEGKHEEVLVPEYNDRTAHYKNELGDCQLDRIWSVFHYTKPFKNILERFKYKREKSLQHTFFPYLQELFEKNITKELWESEKMIIISVPMFLLQYVGRGYNQSELLARQFSKITNIPYETLFYKKRLTKHQAVLDKESRKTNLISAFSLKSKYKDKIAWKSVFLVDDVISTGSTANILAKQLKDAGVKNVYGIFLASGKI